MIEMNLGNKDSNKKDIKDFINNNLKFCENANEEVLEFIGNILYHQGKENCEIIYELFSSGYCYYFALMLKDAFKRGNICIAAPYGHIVWVDGEWHTGLPYDINGLCADEFDVLIPIEELGDKLEDFMHVPGKEHYSNEEDVERLMNKYLKLQEEYFKNN